MIASLALGALSARGKQAFARSRSDENPYQWTVFYAEEAAFETLLPYDLLIFDRTAHPPLEPLIDAGKTVFGYISLGEMNRQRDVFARLQDWGILGEENPNWEGSYFIDVRDTRWVALVIEEMVPAILRRGFQGLFLDTLDNPIELERRDPVANAGMTKASARLIKALKLHWPEVPIILNRGYELLDQVAFDIDHVLGESVYADYDFSTKTYQKVPDPLYREQVEILQQAQRKNPDLSVLSLDYWDPADTRTIAEIYRVQRENGFSPYVATIDLDRIVPEPTG
ncbi:extracellular protein [Thalassobaculum litoreum DSM 18839]|uniref:Extracellular protein n=2 Tax=Thalassobaculum TaxID=526215 RepID=A0A8G2BE86_9PROT|nr:endo alpha-1,4 polygalactosaminidase [Thalassobaculum salexigens]SDF05443.1 extracellular protein [Thalassobaculum litoreum DSM 18839]